MKNLLVATSITILVASGAAQAGGLAPIVDEQDEIILVAPQSSASQYIVPLILLGLLAVASSASGSDGEDDEGEPELLF